MYLCESLSCRSLLTSHQTDLISTFVNKNWSLRLSCIKRHLPQYYAHHDSMTDSTIFRRTYCGRALTTAWCLHKDTHGKLYLKQHTTVAITNFDQLSTCTQAVCLVHSSYSHTLVVLVTMKWSRSDYQHLHTGAHAVFTS